MYDLEPAGTPGEHHIHPSSSNIGTFLIDLLCRRHCMSYVYRGTGTR
jgi:hypothetical protein